MAVTRNVYQCQSCGGQTPKWAGQCPACNEWNSLVEVAPRRGAGRRGGGDRGPAVQDLAVISSEPVPRTPTRMAELDRVLGGGLVPGSVVLVGGEPGIGKSTLLLQAMAQLTEQDGLQALYVTAEESLQQVSLRARRLGLETGGLHVLAATAVEDVLSRAEANPYSVVVVDSIQAVYTEALESAPGGVAQVRECAARLVRYAKSRDVSLFLVGHVTKEGTLAGPRVLEHMVDTVLYFESEVSSRYRVIRATKNRFGAANELGIFAMTEQGLRQVKNPSAIFLSGHEQDVPGSAITVTREGSRPLLVEVQALVDDSQLANPRRVGVGLDPNRLAMLLAVLHRHAGVPVHQHDVFINVVGGVRVGKTAADLPVVCAVVSSLRNRPISFRTVIFGELGLSGEIRPVPNGEERLREAGKHGFERAVIPKANAPRRSPKGMQVIPVTSLSAALDAALGGGGNA